jgi:hypothetical protein
VLVPERDGDRATTTRSTVQTSSNNSLAHSTYNIEILPRLRFAESLANRTLLRLDGLTADEALLAISTTLATAGRWSP